MSGAAGGGAGAGAVVRQGHLRKLKTMKKKFFVLRAETADCSARLEYYESEKKFRAGAAPRRVLPLKSCYNIMRRLDLKQKHVIALFTREEQFCIVAENEQELHAWLTDILKQHRSDDASGELLHPIQHVWQVNVQKKGLGATKTIQGLYNLCLTDKTLTLVKIKSHNNVISDLGIPERVEYSLKNIRRCGDSECFFYMEVGRQTTTGAGELWMHTDDSNIAQSMHSTICHAMRNCAKDSEHERDHITLPKGTPEGNNAFRPRGWSYNGSEKTGSANDKGLCVGSCIKQCVCSSATYSVDDSAAAVAPLAANAEHQSNTLTDKKENPSRLTKHNRTGSLPTGCALFQEPLKIVHTRTKSAPLTGDELDRMVVEKTVMHSSCKAINGTDMTMSSAKKTQWARRASTGTRLFKLSPAHSKNVSSTLRGRSDTMPSTRACPPFPSFELDRPLPRYPDLEGVESSRDETDASAGGAGGEWHRTPRIPEEPDCVDISRDFITTTLAGLGSMQHSRTSSVCEGGAGGGGGDGYLAMAPHEALGGLISASSGSVCSGTPSTDPRFSEYQLDPATSHIGMESRPPRANSVGSRPSGGGAGAGAGAGAGGEGRHRAYSVGARVRPPRHHAAPLPLHPHPHPHSHQHAHAHSRHSTEDHMEIDFSNNSPANRVSMSQTPPVGGFVEPRGRSAVDEYVDMSPRNAGYVEMKPGESAPPPPRTPPCTPLPAPATPDGYVPMNYGRPATRPIAISAARPPPPVATSPEDSRRCAKEIRTPHGSQTLFPFSPDSPASPPELAAGAGAGEGEAEAAHHPLSTVREMSEDGRRSPEVSSSPQYVVLARLERLAAAEPAPAPAPGDELSCNPTATKTLARVADPVDSRVDTTATATVVLAGGGTAARFSLGDEPRSPLPPPSPGAVSATTAASTATTPLNYAALDLEPRRAGAAPAQRAYTQIDFIRSEKLHAADAT